MFDDNNQDQQTHDSTSAATPPEPVPDGSLGFSGSTIDNTAHDTTAPATVPALDDSVTNDSGSTPFVNNESDGDVTQPPPTASESAQINEPAAEESSPETEEPINPPVNESEQTDTASKDNSLDNSSDDLLAIKQQALQQLSPLVDHLDQTPEEKFRTTMMMIQASDDKSLVKAAYEAAGQIQDEKERAQALLDVVNEINYFNQQPKP